MEFFTRVNIEKPSFEVGYDTPLLVIGSCFAMNIGQHLEESLFDVTVNPCGVVYNPMSIARTLSLVIDGQKIDESDLFCRDGMYHSWDFHSSMSSVDPKKAVEKINGSIAEAHEQIQRSRVVILTFGSTRYYSLADSGRVVANCHKMPASAFTLTDAPIDEMTETMTDVIEKLGKINSEVRIILTVSPVRYKAYGYHESQLMKAKLLLMCDRLVKEGNRGVVYFPSYEIMNDELRDYRFYDEDMIHPSGTAVKYIFGRFADTYFSDQTKQLMKQAGQLSKRAAHRFLTDNNAQAEAFKSETREMARRLEVECPAMGRAIKKLLG